MEKRDLLLSVDPGKHNFAWCIMDSRGELLECGLLHNTINDFKIFNQQYKRFSEEVTKLLYKYRNDNLLLVSERFVPRSMHRGNLGELINIQIGVLVTILKQLFPSCGVMLLMASTWKNHRTRNQLELDIMGLTEHEKDSISMGYYFLLDRKYISIYDCRKHVDNLRRRCRLGYGRKNF
jgi:hypothetical protein